MKLEGEQVLLRIHLRNTDRHGWFSPPAAEELVRRAKATVWPGPRRCAASSAWT